MVTKIMVTTVKSNIQVVCSYSLMQLWSKTMSLHNVIWIFIIFTVKKKYDVCYFGNTDDNYLGGRAKIMFVFQSQSNKPVLRHNCPQPYFISLNGENNLSELALQTGSLFATRHVMVQSIWDIAISLSPCLLYTSSTIRVLELLFSSCGFYGTSVFVYRITITVISLQFYCN